MNSRFQNAINRKVQAVPPIWFMRQAGRYHSHYQKLREKYSFMELCKNPELAAEVAMGPMRDFDFDVAILFSDLLFPLEALGMGLRYTDQKGPELSWQLRAESLKDFHRVEDAIPRLKFQAEAMAITRSLLSADKSLIGFVGGTWTLFSYAVQGRHDGGLLESKKQLGIYDEFLKLMLPLLKENIRMQLDAGAEVVMIFDTSAGELNPELFRKCALKPLVELANTFPKRLGYYSKGTQPDHFKFLPEELKDFAVLAGRGLDHRWDLPALLKASNQRGEQGFVQGNFDQALLHLSTSEFKTELRKYFESYKELSLEDRRGWVCALGHGVLPKTPVDHVKYFVNSAREVFS